MRWLLPESNDLADIRDFGRQLGVAPFVAELLWRRGFREGDAAQRFLTPRLKTLHEPFLLPDMDAAVTRLLDAIDRGERIVLYGDYDVDGVTSLALLTRVLRAYGADPQSFLPLRIDEGYGLSVDGVVRCLSTHGPQLLIAVDCGTSSPAEIAALQAQGVDVVVLDHHECPDELPKCVALVNPKLGPDFHYLCSVGIVFKLAHALLKRRPVPSFDLREHLDLVALGTVADLVPLQDENRIFVKRGLTQLAHSRWVGLNALIEIAGLRAPFKPADVGFGIGPRLNAAGRLGTAQDSLELLLTEDPSRARTLANSLDQQNRDRRAVEEGVLVEAEAQLAERFQPERDAAIVVGAVGWHPGVVGIVASRLLRRYHRPTLVVAIDADGMGKGSGRSIPGFSLVESLGRCAHLLERFGGHEMAAGLTLRGERLPEFREAFCACAREMLSDDQLEPSLRLDAELSLGEIGLDLLAEYESLQPFGTANPEPIFFARGVTPVADPRVLKEKHLSFLFRQGANKTKAIWFNAAVSDLPQPPWDVAFTIDRNEWQGYPSAQLYVKALRAAG